MNRIYLTVLSCAMLGGIAQVLLKLGSKDNNTIWHWANFYIFAGLFLYGIAMIGYLWALPQGEVSVLYPLLASSYIFVAILSAVFLKEPLTLWKVIGSIGIIISVGVIVA